MPPGNDHLLPDGNFGGCGVEPQYLSSQTEFTAEPVAELPVEVAEEVKAVSSALAERINQLAPELNDKAVRVAAR